MFLTEEDLRAPRAATLRGHVEARLRAAIISGRFKPGERLVERQLCEFMAVSRPSIREAMRQLEAEGLVTTQHHRGPAVATITADEARQLYAARFVLEGFVGEQCALRGAEADRRALTSAVKVLERVVAKGGDNAELISATTQFYDALIEGAGNIFVRQMLTVIHNRVTLLRVTSMSGPGRLEHSLAEIREIHDAVLACDPVAARAACERHIAAASVAALAVMNESQSQTA